jgi:energy-converting hydrogenase B subunit D
MALSDLLLFFMLLAALVLVLSPRLIHSLIALSIFSSLLTIQYVFLKAPDVAITEAALGAGLSTLVYLTAIRKTTARPQEKPAENDTAQTHEERSMIALQDYIKPENLHLLASKKREQIIQELLQYCLHDMDPGFVSTVTHEVLRERHSASPLDMNLGKGFALVHARHDQCPEVRFALGLLPERRHLYKGDKIHTVIGIVLPSSQSRQYLAFLARFGRLMYNKEAPAVFEEAGKLYAAGKAAEARERLSGFVHTFEEA